MAKFLLRPGATEFLRAKGVPMGDNALEKLASRDDGPSYVLIQGRALYQEADLLEWIAAQAARPKSPVRRGRPAAKQSQPDEAAEVS